MNYYYKGQKVRTSDRIYTHGILYDSKIIACCSTILLAQKRFIQEVNYRSEQMRQYESNKEYYKILRNRYDSLTIVELEVK